MNSVSNDLVLTASAYIPGKGREKSADVLIAEKVISIVNSFQYLMKEQFNVSGIHYEGLRVSIGSFINECVRKEVTQLVMDHIFLNVSDLSNISEEVLSQALDSDCVSVNLTHLFHAALTAHFPQVKLMQV